MNSTLGTIDETVDAPTEAFIIVPPEAEEKQHQVKEGVKTPKPHKDQVPKTGRESTHPVILDKATFQGRQTPIPMIPLPPPPPPTSHFHTSSATYPGEGHWDNWKPQASYRQEPQYEKSWNDQWRGDSYAPQQGYRPWENYRPLSYGRHPSSPYTSLLHVSREPQRIDHQGQDHANASSPDLHFRKFKAWLESQRQGFQRVRLLFLSSYIIPCQGVII
jgi:hypothetical protein